MMYRMTSRLVGTTKKCKTKPNSNVCGSCLSEILKDLDLLKLRRVVFLCFAYISHVSYQKLIKVAFRGMNFFSLIDKGQYSFYQIWPMSFSFVLPNNF